jgi:zinc protease
MKFSTLSLVALFLVASTNSFSQEKKNKDSIKSVTVATVLNKYVDAIGGAESLQKIENKIQKTSMMTSMNMGGTQTNMESKMIQAITKDGKIVSITGVDDALQSKVYFDGNEGYTYLSAFGSKTPFDQNMIDL